MTTHELTLPKGGKTMEEGMVVEWLLEEGDPVSAGEPVVVFDSEKMTSEVTAPADGVLVERAVPEGETVPVGTLLGRISDSGEEPSPEPASGNTSAAEGGIETDGESSTDVVDAEERSFRSTPSARRVARKHDVSLEAVAAETGAQTVTPDLIERFVADDPSTDSDGRRHIESESDGAIDPSELSVDPVANPPESDVLGSPWARVLAAEYGVSVEAIGETLGTDRVRAEHVREYASERDVTREVVSEADDDGAVASRTVHSDTSEADPTPAVAREETLTGPAGVMFDRMERVNREYASTTTVARVDVTELMGLYDRLSSVWTEQTDASPSITAFVLRGVGRALPDYETLNAEVVGDREIRVYDDINVGIAVDTDNGLLVPTIYGADELTVRELSREIERLATGARDRSLDRTDLENGTFTVSNAGNLGAYINTPQINPPQTAILGVCAVSEEPGVVDGEVVPRKFMHLTLTYDHRIVEGSTAVGFLQRVATLLESPEALLS